MTAEVIGILPTLNNLGPVAILAICVYFLYKGWQKCLVEKREDKDKYNESIMRASKERNEAILEIAKTNERTVNVLQNLEKKMEENHKESIAKLNTIKEDVTVIKSRRTRTAK